MFCTNSSMQQAALLHLEILHRQVNDEIDLQKTVDLVQRFLAGPVGNELFNVRSCAAQLGFIEKFVTDPQHLVTDQLDIDACRAACVTDHRQPFMRMRNGNMELRQLLQKGFSGLIVRDSCVLSAKLF